MNSTPLNIRRINARRDDLSAAVAELREKLSTRGDVMSGESRRRTIAIFGTALGAAEVATTICGQVRRRGLEAVLEYSKKIDGAELTAETLRVPAADLKAAHERANPEFLATIRRIRQNILRFQKAILHTECRVDLDDGAYLAERYVPLRRVGVCVPGGAAAYPSTVLMTAVPAQAAGVEEIAVVAPPTKFGANNPDVLATCHELGITEVYRVGGAQAVAALAYGVSAIERVDKIVGPGNLFVALAKKLVYGEVDIDSIAGPSEVVVVGDATTRADYTAADMIAQAEHSPGASVLVTWSADLIEATDAELSRQLGCLSRGDLARQSLEDYGALVLVSSNDQAAEVVNLIAPEHLHLAFDDAERFVPKVRNAGAIFVGNHSPVALGDYVAGPSHVLPTSGTARFASGLTANDFLRPMSVIRFTPKALERVAGDVRAMAEVEGLSAHWASVERRLEGDAGSRKETAR